MSHTPAVVELNLNNLASRPSKDILQAIVNYKRSLPEGQRDQILICEATEIYAQKIDEEVKAGKLRLVPDRGLRLVHIR